MTRIAIALFWGLLFASGAEAQPAKMSVHLSFSGNDSIGTQLAYRFREEISSSSRYAHSFQKTGSDFIVHLITINPDIDENRSNWTAYSYTVNFQNKEGVEFFLTSVVGTCGAQKVAQCASNLTARLDQTIQNALQGR